MVAVNFEDIVADPVQEEEELDLGSNPLIIKAQGRSAYAVCTKEFTDFVKEEHFSLRSHTDKDVAQMIENMSVNDLLRHLVPVDETVGWAVKFFYCLGDRAIANSYLQENYVALSERLSWPYGQPPQAKTIIFRNKREAQAMIDKIIDNPLAYSLQFSYPVWSYARDKAYSLADIQDKADELFEQGYTAIVIEDLMQANEDLVDVTILPSCDEDTI